MLTVGPLEGNANLSSYRIGYGLEQKPDWVATSPKFGCRADIALSLRRRLTKKCPCAKQPKSSDSGLTIAPTLSKAELCPFDNGQKAHSSGEQGRRPQQVQNR